MKRLVLCLLCVCAAHLSVAAHVLDQYLQVAQIALAPDSVRIELRLIPGVQVAEQVCAQIDVNADEQITTMEEQAYARRVSQDIAFAINDINTPLALTDIQFPTQQEMRAGLGTIRLTLIAAATFSAADQQQVYFRNNHLPELGVYLVNALMPTMDELKIGGQKRDALQRELRLDYHITPTNTTLSWRGIAMLLFCLVLLLWGYLRHFLRRPNNPSICTEETFT